ncbi:MAG: aminotransferase class V-fold PLP-dependent enzyme [Planctomycetes bacterium]|nr:aminotransferase class V-fold PLP-dependent enzyme [Planctomycetota bacterium]
MSPNDEGSASRDAGAGAQRGSTPDAAGDAELLARAPGTPGDAADLDLSPAQMSAFGQRVLERAVAHLSGVERMPVCGDVDAEDLCRALVEPRAPEAGRPLDELLDPLFDEWIPRSFTTISPGYMAYVPGGGLFAAALADLLSDATNRYTGIRAAAPALVQLEANVLDWLVDWMGYPPTARGLLTTGGSQANFSALVAAREAKLGEHLREGVLYVSTQVHHCVTKAARLAGILPDRVRAVDVDAAYRLDLADLARKVAADRAAGLRPFCVVSSAGTTNTGAVDPLRALAAFCAEHDLWHHCDGAYGAFFHVVPELRELLDGLPLTDSLTLDPHKGLFLPYGTGALLVRDGEALRAAHAATAGYLPSPSDDLYDPSQYGPELSRDFRGLRVWLPVKLHGAGAFVAALREKRALAVDAHRRIAALPGVVIDAPPQLSLFAFHLTWSGATREQEDAATAELCARVTRRGRVMITGCQAGGRFLARVCVLCFRTRARHVDACVEDVAEAAAAIVAERG